LRQHLGSCVSGDHVVFRLDQQGNGVVEAIKPRTSELTRPTPHAGIKTIVANVEQVFVVVAPLPDYSSLILDRYLVACELAQIPAHIVLNKTDLLDAQQQTYFEQQLNIYRSIGYLCFSANCTEGFGIDQLLPQMSGKRSILVGQSGVGKSSLINRLLPNVQAITGGVSENSRLGTHTTTASRLYFLPDNGWIIDSPGVREFGLSHINPERLIDGFIELKPHAGECKFRNCRHLNEKGCAIITAANEGKITHQRLENYQKIYQQLVSD
jgi:ribosome biogenesis GTPase